MKCVPSICFLCFLIVGSSWGQDQSFRPLFNGQNFDGWVRVNTDESTWSVQDGMLTCTGKPIGELRTTRMYQNFILELEWRHMKPRGNAGVFVWADDITAKGVPFHRSIEVQVLENDYGNSRSHTTHGDIFPIHGATMTPINGRGGSRAFPTEYRSNPSPEWNHYRIECRDGEISLAVNGKVVTRGKECLPRKGYICIESEGGVVHYRNMRIQELPSSPVSDPAEVAIADRGYRCLYTGIDLEDFEASTHWTANDWRLQASGTGTSRLATKQTFGNVGFLFDFKVDEKSGELEFSLGNATVTLTADDSQWHRVEGTCKDGNLVYTLDGGLQQETTACPPVTPNTQLQWSGNRPASLANIYVREL